MLPRTTLLGYAIVAIALLLTGCSEFAQRRLGRPDESPPQPAPPLQIANPPSGADKATTTPMPPQPTVALPKPESTDAPIVALRAMAQKANHRHQTLESYMMRLKRREFVGGKARPEELILVKFRQEPFSVYFKWIGTEAKGREVVFVKGRPGNEIHTLTAAGDIILLPAGARFSVAADSVLVKAKSRYPITEAGLGSSIRRFGSLVDAVAKGDTTQGTLKYLGWVKRPEFEEPVEGALQTIPASSDPLLPGGGQRWWFFDKTMGLPALVLAHDEKGREVEYYLTDRIQSPVRLDDDDFSPDKLWKKKGQ